MGKLDSITYYSIFVWYLLSALLFLLHISIQDAQVLTHIALAKSSFYCIS